MPAERARLTQLAELVATASRGLKGVRRHRLFGCEAFYAGEVIFALVWRSGRIGLRFTSARDYQALARLEGTRPWQAGRQTMSQWLFLPEQYHEDPRSLAAWVRRAHAAARSGGPPRKKSMSAMRATRRPAPGALK